jgi:hypothetical protein
MTAGFALDRAISVEAACAEYGVVLSPDAMAVDHDATKECPDAMRRARGPIRWVFDRGGEHGREE